jgi:hypothetical protein
MRDQLWSWIGILIGAVSLILQLTQMMTPRRRYRRTVRKRSWKCWAIEHTRLDEIDDFRL